MKQWKVWNADAAKPACKFPMCKRSAIRIADALERDTRDTHVVLPA